MHYGIERGCSSMLDHVVPFPKEHYLCSSLSRFKYVTQDDSMVKVSRNGRCEFSEHIGSHTGIG